MGAGSGYQSAVASPYQLSGSAGRDADQEYVQLNDRVAQSIQQIANNVGTMTKLVNLLGTPKDTQDLRDQLHDVSEATKEAIKEANKDLKTLGKLDGGSPSENQARRRQQQSLSTKLKAEADRYAVALRNAQTKEREFVAQARKIQANKQNEAFKGEEDSAEETRNLLQEEKRRQQIQALQGEIEFNEEIIVEREEGIDEITGNIKIINEIMNDLSKLVNEQQTDLDQIEDNVHQTVDNTKNANTELKTASDYQKSARNKMCCILMIFVVIITIIVVVLVLKLT